MEEFDKRYITKEFLKKYFPRNRDSNSERAYLDVREEINQRRKISGRPRLSDEDLCEVIDVLRSKQ